jgi:hypothetical protein
MRPSSSATMAMIPTVNRLADGISAQTKSTPASLRPSRKWALRLSRSSFAMTSLAPYSRHALMAAARTGRSEFLPLSTSVACVAVFWTATISHFFVGHKVLRGDRSHRRAGEIHARRPERHGNIQHRRLRVLPCVRKCREQVISAWRRAPSQRAVTKSASLHLPMPSSEFWRDIGYVEGPEWRFQSEPTAEPRAINHAGILVGGGTGWRVRHLLSTHETPRYMSK